MEYGASQSATQRSISHLLASADVERGRHLSRSCQMCHGDLECIDTDMNAPVFWNIVGREKACQTGVDYSDAMQRVGVEWTFDELNTYLARPGGFVPGTAMSDINTSSEESRIDFIAFLRTLSDEPVPLP